MTKFSLKQQVEQQIANTGRDVFLRTDFAQLGGYDQVGRALRKLVAEGKLLKIGYGLYPKSLKIRVGDERVRPQEHSSSM